MRPFRLGVHGAAFLCVWFLASPSQAVVLNPDGVGQGLIFPYYSVQRSNGDSQNTFLSLVNNTGDAKALRVRVHEASNAADVGSFNLFLGPRDTWTAAIVPSTPAGNARLLTYDKSCVSKLALSSGGPAALELTATPGPVGAKEGWIEAIEMGTVTGASAAALAPDSSGTPANSPAVMGTASVSTAAPTGGISGTFTIINVANGMEFSGNATALADLAKSSFYRNDTDPYPSLNAAEIEPVSIVESGGYIYRSFWSRSADAVSAVLMKRVWLGEFILDAATASNTDVVATFPTRQFYITGTASPLAPFSDSCSDSPAVMQRELATLEYADREGKGGRVANANSISCAAAQAFDFQSSANPTPRAVTGVLGSMTNAWLLAFGSVILPAGTPNGSFVLTHQGTRGLTSLGTSTRTTISTGEVVISAHTYLGLPIVGFTARTFVNGTLSCNAGTCQGNYGALFPLKFVRSITPGG